MTTLSPATLDPNPGHEHSATVAVSALRDRSSHLRLWPIAAVVLASDLWTKHWAFSSLGPEEAFEAIPNWLVFRRSLNPGALFGMGPGLSSVFIVASIVALVFVLFLFAQSDRRARSLHLALGLILAGAMGNLYDRTFVIADVLTLKDEQYRLTGILQPSTDPDKLYLGSYPEGEPVSVIPASKVVRPQRQGVVRDFIKFEGRAFGHELWPWVFNVADSALVVGVSLLMLNFIFDHRRHTSRAATEATEMAAVSASPSP